MASAPNPRSVALNAFGVPITLHVGGNRAAEADSAIRSAWERCLVSQPSRETTSPNGVLQEEPTYLEVILDDNPLVVGGAAGRGAVAGNNLDALMHALSPAVTVAAITRRAGSLLMLHACALADPVSGATVVFVGPSGMGKTMIARMLGRSLAYVTDETVAVLPDNTVLAYPKPLSTRFEGQSAMKEQLSPGRIGLLLPPPHLTLAAVVLLDRHDGGPHTPSVQVVPTLLAITEVAAQVSFLPQLASPLKRLAAMCAHVGGLRRVGYSEAADLSESVHELLLQSSTGQDSTRQDSTRQDSRGDTSGVQGSPGRASRARRCAVQDEVLEDDQCVVMVQDTVLLLSPLATRVLALAGDGADITQIAVVLEQEFGPPGGGHQTLAITLLALQELAGQQLVEIW